MKITIPIVFKGSETKAEAQSLIFGQKCFVPADDRIVHPVLYTWSYRGRLCLILVSNILVFWKNEIQRLSFLFKHTFSIDLFFKNGIKKLCFTPKMAIFG